MRAGVADGILNGAVTYNLLFMANPEMQQVLAPDVELLRAQQRKLCFLYGA